MNGLTQLGLLLEFAGAVAIYLASPHQRWLTVRLPPAFLLAMGASLFFASIVTFLAVKQAVTAIFVFVVWLMLLWSIFPYVGVMISRRRGA